MALRLSLRDKRSPALTAPQTLPSARLGDLAVCGSPTNLCEVSAALRLAPFLVFGGTHQKSEKRKRVFLLLFLVTTKMITILYVGGQKVRIVTSQQKFNTPLVNFFDDIK